MPKRDRWSPRPRSRFMQTRTTSALLYLNAVSVSFDGFRAINDLSLAIEPGEMRAIIGPDGGGYDLTTLDETQIATLGIGRKFQKPTVFEMHTVEDNLRLALKGDRQARKTLVWRETVDEQARINEIFN